MKKLFNYFNEIDININEFEEMEVSEFERAQFKKNLRKQIKSNSSQKWTKGIAAACLTIGISAASLVGLSYTTFAQEIPFVNSIFKLFSEKEYGTTLVGYDKFAEAENMKVESNGTTITITETLLDSKKLLVSYSIETDKDLGPIALIDGSFTLNGEQNSLFHAEHDIYKIAHNKYVGMTTAILPLSHSIDEGTFQFNIRELSNPENGEVVQGEWDFEIYAEASDTFVQTIDVPKSEKNNLNVEINKITYTPYSFIVNYKEGVQNEMLNKKYNVIYSELLVKDDLGNSYKSKFNGGQGSLGVTNYMISFGQLKPDAKTLIFRPVFHFKNLDNIYESVETMQLDDIIVEIER
ncbi:DUF4179 domain-containing protein [Sporosarcina highlanderae]|uniref:DUF4179 domain-containing protein n=1 Tax=Sporosarcina highlanderae TaxID=3035916 RepID=A0ABT8JUV7_9BACL|nr:DUF4179 domain-containing protein [Sporosarcina highlanderae]MDN4608925.1 DUF4179 domain-containing protein [Sporosarcina highlanderae]